MFIPVGSVAFFIRYNLTGDNEPMYNYIGYNPIVHEATDVTTARINAAQAAWWTMIAAEMSAQWSVGPCHCLIGQDGGPPLQISGNTVTAAGTASGESVPQNCALLVKKVGTATGRKNSGRMFIPGLNEAHVNSAGAVTSAAQALWQTDVNELMAGGTVPDALFGSESSGDVTVGFHAVEDPDSFQFEIGALVVQSVIATQRRRLRR